MTSLNSNSANLNGLERLIKLAVLFGLIALTFRILFGNLWHNLGWISMNHSGANGEEMYVEAAQLFRSALQVKPRSRATFYAAGRAHAFGGDEPSAVTSWKQGGVEPEFLILSGQHIWAAGQPNVALVYFRSARLLDKETPEHGSIWAGRICQAVLAEPEILSISNRDFCQDYFASNKNNLLVNADFEHELSWGWSGLPLFKTDEVNILRDPKVSRSGSSLAISSRKDETQVGIYQRISILPGTLLRLSGYFRTDKIGEENSRLLYLEWSTGRQTHGTHARNLYGGPGWEFYEWTWRLPDESANWIQFYPVLLTGEGTVWADDVRIEIVLE